MQTYNVSVAAIREAAAGVRVFDLIGEKRLPDFSAGAHVDVLLPQGLRRSYSLCSRPGEPALYRIAVQRDSAGRGGSAFMHDSVSIDDTLEISEPRNSFPLVEDARESVLVAGGIGITPLWCMIQRLCDLRRPWKLIYGARSRESAAFLAEIDELRHRAEAAVNFHFDDENGGRPPDLQRFIRGVAEDAHLYCCGPRQMIEAFESACSSRPGSHVHVERFQGVPAAGSPAFTVHLARSNRRFPVGENATILDVLLANGIDVPYSCQGGVCGACETRVLSGRPDHRDFVLSEQERALDACMMICCSRAKSAELVLDL
ncbi:MAG: 2Fe-2S iron-sulfur cluster-binding protein [Lautropia sp.]